MNIQELSELDEIEIESMVMDMECNQFLESFQNIYFLCEFMLDEMEFREKHEVRIESQQQIEEMREILSEHRK